MAFVYLCGNDVKGKVKLFEQFKTARKRKYTSSIECGYARDLKSRGQWRHLHFWKDVIHTNFEQINPKFDETIYTLEEEDEETYDISNDRRNVCVVSHCIVDILMDAAIYLKPDELQSLTSDTSKVDPLLKYCQSSPFFMLLTNIDNFGKTNTSDSRKIISEYGKLVSRYFIPNVSVSCTENHAAVVMKVLKEYTFPIDTSKLRVKQSKKSANKKAFDEKPVSNFLFIKPRKRYNNRVCIRTINIKEHEYMNDWVILPQGRTNRFLTRYPFAEKKIVQLYFHISVSSEVVQNMLLNGITVNGLSYSFLGCSSEGLKFRKCYMWNGTEQEVNAIISENGEFDQNVVSKHMARFGLLFSEVMMTNIDVMPEQIKKESDIESDCKRYNFTDGCGSIGLEMAKMVTREINRIENAGLDESRPPSVYKIRLQGYKGVLALDPEMSGNNIKVRPSMKKFNTKCHSRLGVCDYSKPFTFGNLNFQFVTLLSGLGIKDEIFAELQEHHFGDVEKMSVNPESAIRVLQWQNEFDLANAVMETENMGKLSKDLLQSIKKIQTQLYCKSLKLKILIPKSRYIYGVCDPYGILKSGECFVRVTTTGDGLQSTVSGPVVICKSPCLLLGDVRVLSAISERENPDVYKLNGLVDCIVFPVRGVRPHPNEIAGSDLDGDKFFVSWDERIIPNVKKPYDYPAASSKPEGKVTTQKKIMYFSNQSYAQKVTGDVAACFRFWCNIEGILSDKCEQLGMLFSRVIDASKTGVPTEIPAALRVRDDIEPQTKFIWQKMEENARKFRDKLIKGFQGFVSDLNLATIPDKFVRDMLEERQTQLSEIEKFNFAWAHCDHLKSNDEDTLDVFIRKFAQYINFSQVSMEDKRELYCRGLPLDLMMNALSRSRMLSRDDLAWFSMHSSITPWKFYLRKEGFKLDWFYLNKALTSFEGTCVAIELPDNVVIVFEFLQKCKLGLEIELVSGSISALFYSKNFGYKYRYVIGSEYYMDFTDEILQIYRNKERSNTFVWLRKTSNRKDIQETVNTLSVDLSRFYRNIYNNERPHPLLNKAQLMEVEIYMQSDSDAHCDIIESSGDFPFECEPEKDSDGDDDGIYVDVSAILFPTNASSSYITDKHAISSEIKTVAKQGNITQFFQLVSELCNKDGTIEDTHQEALDCLSILLDAVLCKIAPQNIPEAVRENLQACVQVEKLVKDPDSRIQIAELLTRLDVDDIAVQFLHMDTFNNIISVVRYLHILRNWTLLWYLDTGVAKQFIDGITRMVDVNSKNQTVDVLEQTFNDVKRRQYVVRYARLHSLALIHDMEKLKTILAKQAVCPSTVINLKLDCYQDIEKTTVSLYALEGLTYIPKIFAGQFVTVTRQIDLRRSQCYRSSSFIAQVQMVTQAPFRVELQIHGSVPDIVNRSLVSKTSRFWRCDVIGNIITYNRVLDALDALATDEFKVEKIPLYTILTDFLQENTSVYNTESSERQVLSHESQVNKEISLGTYITSNRKTHLYSKLNPAQNLAVQTAITQTVTCIQGSPGTGKTTVACEIIKQISVMKRNKRSAKRKSMLVIAETNHATDNIARRLRNNVLVVRLGTSEGVSNDVYDISLEGQVDQIAQLQGKSATVKDKKGNVQRNLGLYKEVLDKSDVILTTSSGAGDSLLDHYVFEYLLVDEATYTLETTLLCALVHGCKHLIMIGDPAQLSPFFVLPKERTTDIDLPDVTELSRTLYHRLYTVQNIPYVKLNVQYRMHPELLKFPSAEFYDGQLISNESVQNIPAVVFPWPDPSRPICFLNVNGTEQPKGSSFFNENEAQTVSDVVETLLKVSEAELDSFSKSKSPRPERLSFRDITVLTFYQGQVNSIKDKMKTRISVSTVDGYQGCENDVIVASTVRANDRGSLGFSDDKSRLNVLFTRAKRALIIVGNKQTLRTSELWRKWLQGIPELNVDQITVLSEKQQTFAYKYEKPYTKSVTGKKTRRNLKFKT